MKFPGVGELSSVSEVGKPPCALREAVDRILFRGRLSFLWLALVVVAIYGPTWSFDFVQLDDVMLIRENMAFLKNPRNFPKAFTQHYFKPESVFGFYYRPLVTLSYMVDAWLGNGAVWPFRLTNLMLHILAVWGVFLFLAEALDRWGAGGCRTAFWGALLFAVHPAHAMAVAWVPGRNDELLAVFLLAALVGFLRHERTGSGWAMAIHLAALFLALLTKEAAVVIPVLCAAWKILVGGEPAAGNKGAQWFLDRMRLLPWIGWIGIVFLWLIIRGAVLGIPAFLNQSAFILSRLSLLSAFLLRYFGKALAPFDMRLIPTFSDTSAGWGLAAGVASGMAVFLVRPERRSLLLFGLFWFFGLLVLAIPYRQEPDLENLGLLEHRLYVPLIGLLLFWAVVLAETVSSGRWALMVTSLFGACVVAAIWTGISVRRIPAFRGAESFWTTAVRESPRSDLASLGLAVFHLDSGQLEEGKRELDRTLELNPRRRYLHLNLGAYYFQKKDYERAEAMFKQEVELYPESLFAYRHLAHLCQKLGRYNEARQWYQRSQMMERAIETHVRSLAPDVP